jgi:hypothetical protein
MLNLFNTISWVALLQIYFILVFSGHSLKMPIQCQFLNKSPTLLRYDNYVIGSAIKQFFKLSKKTRPPKNLVQLKVQKILIDRKSIIFGIEYSVRPSVKMQILLL